MIPPVLDIAALRKTYIFDELQVPVLHDLNLQVHAGEFVAIMGTSGSGKSTLMNIIGCLDLPTSGQYRLDGIPVGELDDDALSAVRHRKIGFVFQNFHLLARTSALENVELPAAYSDDVDFAEVRRRARSLLGSVGLADREDHTPTRMSGGQQQRVAIARALINNPTLLLADEPTGNLDSRTSREILGLFQALNDGGKTLMIVTHDGEVARHARRVIVLRDGRIAEDRPVADRLVVAPSVTL